MRLGYWVAGVVLAVAISASCGGSETAGSAGSSASRVASGDVAMNKEAYGVFPDADAGADPSVPADAGGAGFTGEGWQTNTDYDLIGDPRAVKGGVYREYELDFPGTMRIYGPETYAFNYMVQTLVYETLLGVHPTTLQFIPALATHWQISDDRLTYRFRLNPNARFSDGEPVLADDVVASWRLVMDESLNEPNQRLLFEKFDPPVAESPYIVRVTSRELNWQNFFNLVYYLPILPAHALATVDGATYLRDYNVRMLPGSGPYIVGEGDVVAGQTISLRRRTDYWAAQHRRNIGAANFDELRYITIRDQALALERFKRGDFDSYYVNISREWVEDLTPANVDRIQRGLILKRKVFNHAPRGIQGVAINMRQPPLDDLRVRQALTLLLNRPVLMEKLFYNEYVPLNSYFPGGVYTNPDNPENVYNPERALALLAEAGWTNRDGQGRLTRNGQPLELEFLYADQGAERWLTVYQEDLRRVGITLNLRLVTYETQLQLKGERRFELGSVGWTASLFPDPQQLWHSSQADALHSFNYSGFKSDRADELMAAYYREFNQERRVDMIREIDGILASQYPYVLEWDAPFRRIVFWNRFGYPAGVFTRTGDYFLDMPTYWWIDPEKEARLQQAMRDSSTTLDPGVTDVHYWDEIVGDSTLSLGSE